MDTLCFDHADFDMRASLADAVDESVSNRDRRAEPAWKWSSVGEITQKDLLSTSTESNFSEGGGGHAAAHEASKFWNPAVEPTFFVIYLHPTQDSYNRRACSDPRTG